MVKPKLHDASRQGRSILHGKNHGVTTSCLLVGPFLHGTTPALVVVKKDSFQSSLWELRDLWVGRK
jgi:hypothetical protein